MNSSENNKKEKSWNELLRSVQSYRRKLSNLSTKVPGSFTFRRLSPELVRLYFLSVPADGCETTLLYIDIPQNCDADLNQDNATEDSLQNDNVLPWCSLLEKSFQMRHQVKQYSKEEQLLRERKRQVTWGITSYEINIETGKFVFPVCGGLFMCNDDENSQAPYFPAELMSSVTGTRLNCQICPHDQDLVSYVRDHDLWVQHTESGCETRLTFAHKGLKSLSEDPLSAGVPSYIIQEEFDRYSGHWWQPSFNSDVDGVYRILYEEVDDSQVDILHFPVTAEDGTVEEFRFPRAGTPNSKSILKIVQFRISDTGQVEDVCHCILQESLETLYPWAEYVVRVGWTPDGQYVWAILLNRLQTFLQLVFFPLSAYVPVDCSDESYSHVSLVSSSQVVYEEKSESWLNIHDNLYFLPVTVPGEITFIWVSEETGFRHLYLITTQISTHQSLNVNNGSPEAVKIEYGYIGPVIKQKIALTSGSWEVLPKNIWVDETRQLIYFMGLRDSPLEKHLYVVSMNNPHETVRLTEPGHSHCVHVDLDCDMFATVMSSTTSMPSSRVYSIVHSGYEAVPNVQSIKAVEIATVLKSAAIDEENLHTEIFSYQISSGHEMYGIVFKPPRMIPGKKYPTVLVIYGGPEVQLISNTFKGLRQLRQLMLASEGYVVVSIDNRGSRHRGVEFEAHIKNRLGTVEIADQVEVLELLAKDNHFIDLSRIAIHGWSYGGYLSLMGLAQRPDFFKVAIAGAPVTSWVYYDTGYTERYIGLPSDNPHSYKLGSVLSYASQFPDEENRLLILHGLIDENVHFTHTSQLINSLLKARKPYQLQVYPNERHSLRHLEASEHFETTLLSFLNQWL